MSADSIIPFQYDTQAFNRYSYVKNNPLKYTDPSGHSWFSKQWKKLKKWTKKNWRTIVTIAVVTVATIATGWFGGVALAGSLGMTTTTLGGSILVGAVVGGIGGYFGHSTSFFNPGEKGMLNAGMKALSHGVSRAAIARTQGQSATAAFWSGFAASGFSVGSNGYGGVAGRTTIMAVVSGTVSEATCGKFANGAVSGAFIHMFNDYSDRLANRVAFGDRKEESPIFKSLGRGYDNVTRGISGVNKLMLLDRPNDPMFQMLRYKAIGNSSNVKLLKIQPNISDLNLDKR